MSRPRFFWDEIGRESAILRQGKGHQKVGTWQEVAALCLKPAIGLVLVTLRAGTIPAGVVREDFPLAVITLMDVASEERRAAGGNIPQSLVLDRAQADAGLLAIRRAVEARQYRPPPT